MGAFHPLISVLILIAMGTVLQKTGFFQKGFLEGMNRLTYWVGLPALIFIKTATTEPLFGQTARVLSVVIGTMFVTMLLAYIAARLMKIPKGSVATFIHTAFRANPGYIGFPILVFASQHSGSGVTEQTVSIAGLVLGMMAPFAIFCAVIMLVLDDPRTDVQRNGLYILKQILLNPILIGGLSGILLGILNVPIPAVFNIALTSLGEMALILGLLAIGASLAVSKIKGNLARALTSALIRVGAGPVITFFIALSMGLNGEEMRIAMIYMACPSAMTSYVMASQLGGDESLASSTIMVSTLLSFLSLAAVFYVVF